MDPSRTMADSPSPSVIWYRRSSVVAALFFLVLMILFAPLVQYLVGIANREDTLKADYWARAFITRLEGRLDENLAVGYGLEAQISVLGNLEQAELDVVAARLLKDHLDITHVAIAPDLVIRAIYPLAGNEKALGLNHRDVKEEWPAVARAIKSHEIVLVGPIDLVQGAKRRLVARLPTRTMDGQLWGLVSLVIDVDRLFAEAGLDEMQRRYQVALRNVERNSLAFGHILGDSKLFNGQHKVHPVDVPGGSWQLAVEPRQSTEVIGVAMLYWAVAAIIGLLASVAIFYLRRFTLQRESHVKQLEMIAATDTLTQLTSRYQFDENLRQLIEECRRSFQGFTVLFIDLDHFKDINDSLGHAVGDELLVHIARVLKSCLRGYDLLCRQSGDEFIAVFKNVTGTVEIESRARAITSKIAEPVQIGANTINVTCSIGIAVYPTDGTDPVSLIQHADLAMYESKRVGRNAIYFFNMSMRNEVDRYIELSRNIRIGLIRSEFSVHYQPLYSISEDAFTRCEALCRWRQADGTYISPFEFIAVAEQSGLILELGAWVAEQALQFCKELFDQHYEIGFSINRSPREFGSTPYTHRLIKLRKQLAIPPRLITLEITESLLMSDNYMKSENLSTLKSENFQFSIDDFGTGYSAINYLRQYPVESLKIDRSFIAELGVSRQADTLVKVIVQMAKSLNIKVIAEGVETRGQVDFLTAIGCDFLQGFYFAKPMPKAEFLEFIRAHAKQQAGNTQDRQAK